VPRAPRTLAAGLLYHVTARGNAKAPIFLVDADWEVFLSGLAVARNLDGMLCHAYCLMENHYHLLVETPRANLDDAMQRLNGTYAIRFNRHHVRTGHVFQGRYGATLITDDDYALAVVQYIACNPVRAGACTAPQEWRWSSYAATAGLEPRPAFLTTRVLEWFGDRDAYQEFVAAGLDAVSRELRPSLGEPSLLGIRQSSRRPTANTDMAWPRSPTISVSTTALCGVRFVATSQGAILVPDPVFAPHESGVSMQRVNTLATWA